VGRRERRRPQAALARQGADRRRRARAAPRRLAQAWLPSPLKALKLVARLPPPLPPANSAPRDPAGAPQPSAGPHMPASGAASCRHFVHPTSTSPAMRFQSSGPGTSTRDQLLRSRRPGICTVPILAVLRTHLDAGAGGGTELRFGRETGVPFDPPDDSRPDALERENPRSAGAFDAAEWSRTITGISTHKALNLVVSAPLA
jgi:hypothetical protein